ncbi:MAG: 30S ribosomal protein S4 [Planctomycetes bacterium]|nr:30S ribosomal protein S4 [Planctomycetota bacterium]
MARVLGAKCRVCRRMGLKLFLKGARCETAKCAMEKDKKRRPPGAHGEKRIRSTDFGIHLREVQRAKKMYGLLQRQFRRYYDEAERQPGNTGDVLVQMLERRLDNVVYRMRFAISRDHARQMILHGHFRVSGKKVSVPSYFVSAGDIVEPAKREKSQKIVKEAYAFKKMIDVPSWLKVEEEPLRGTVVQLPVAGEVAVPLESQLIVEFMSR